MTDVLHPVSVARAALAAVCVAAAVVLVSPGAAMAAQASQGPSSERVIEVQRRLQDSRAAYDRALTRLDALSRHRAAQERRAEAAARLASSATAQVDPSSSGLWGTVDRLTGGADELDRAQARVETAQHLQELVTIAEQGLVQARSDARDAAREHRAAAAEAALIEQSTAARAAARLARQQARLPLDYQASSQAQDRRNRTALVAWHEQLAVMGAAGVVPPAPDALAGRSLPDGVRPLHDDAGRLVRGVGLARGTAGTTFAVVPDVTVRAVSAAFASLGTVTDPGACTTFVSQVWDTAQVDVPIDGAGLWESLPAVPERQVTVGDVVFLDRPDGYGVGIAVSGRDVIALDPARAEVAVERVSAAHVLAVRRVPLEADLGERVAAVPQAVLDGCVPPAPVPLPTETVDAAALAGVDVVGGWTYPLIEGSYTMSAAYGVSGSLWSSGQHTGQDFAAPLGTPVVAAAAGRVSVETTSWAGELVRIDHGGGVETHYAHMSRVDVTAGDVVAAGDVIGAVGSEGNSTGPHLHFEVWVGGRTVDPMPFLAQARP